MDYRDNRQRWAESHQVVHFYAGQWCTFTPALTPVAHAYQDKLMADLDSAEMRLLEKLLSKIESGVAAIGKEGFGLTSGLDTAAHGRGRFNGH